MLGFAGIVQSGNRSNPLLDTYSGAAAAYSLRRLRTAYAGSAVRVRRSTDSVEQDIGFDANGNLDESSLQTFCGENLSLYSQTFSNAYWGKINCSITSSSITDPIGGTNATEITASATSGVYVGMSNLGIGNITGTYIGSFYVKKGIGFVINVGGGTSGVGAVFNGITGAYLGQTKVGTVFSLVSYTCISYNADYWRASITTTSSITDGAYSYSVCVNKSGGLTWNSGWDAVVGDKLVIWGAQVNTGSLKPYVQTTTAARDGMGYVTKWYDQSGNARDAAQTTAANQPRIVNAGVVEKQGGKPTLFFDGVNDELSSNTVASVFTGNNVLIYSSNVVKSNISNSSANYSVWGFGRSTSLNPLRFFGQTISTNKITLDERDDSLVESYSLSGTIDDYSIITAIATGSTQTLWDNGGSIAGASNTLGTITLDLFSIGCLPRVTKSAFWSGYISEIILHSSNLSTSRTAIESNINTYYQIF